MTESTLRRDFLLLAMLIAYAFVCVAILTNFYPLWATPLKESLGLPNYETIEGLECWDGYSENFPSEMAAHAGVPLLEIDRPPEELEQIPETTFHYIYLDPGKICGIERLYGRYPRNPGDKSIRIRVYQDLNLWEIADGTPPPPTAEAEISRIWTCHAHPGEKANYETICYGEIHGFGVQAALTYSIEESEAIVARIKVVE